MKTLAKLWRLLTAAERRHALSLAALMFLVGIVEVTGILSTVPLVAVLTSASDPCIRLGASAAGMCERLLPSRDPYVLGSLAFALIAGSNALAFVVTWLSARLNWSLWRRLSAEVFDRYLQKPYEYFFDVHSAGIVRNVVFETERFANLVVMPVLVLLSRLIVATAVIATVVAVEPWVSIILVGALTGLYGLVYRRLRGRVRASGETAFEARHRISTITAETAGGVREVRMLGSAPHFAARFDRAAATLAKQYVYGMVMSVAPRYVIETGAFAVMLGVAVYLSHKLGDWQSAAPLLAFYVLAAYRLLPQFQQIYTNAMVVQQNAVIVDALVEATAPPVATAVDGEASARPRVPLAPPIRIRSLTYRYPGTSKAVLERTDMEIPARATVGLVGATGAGKSTIIDLIAGLLQPNEGAVELNGVTLDARLAPSWRARIGYVPQVLFLLDDTIRRNIAFGLDDAAISFEAVERAARAANIHEFVAGLPEGYDTVVGERGVRLSGGQRQRLVIARALYRDPDVLIFDEATSALDQETEQAVMEAIRNLSHRKTLLIISHRPATLAGCDLVYEVADGRIRRIRHESQA
jgi:ATP-binding cassette, subfamily B, bacterial PglK